MGRLHSLLDQHGKRLRSHSTERLSWPDNARLYIRSNKRICSFDAHWVDRSMRHARRGKEKPLFHHAAVILFLTIVFAFFVASSYALDLTAEMTAKVLDLGGIQARYLRQQSLMQVRLMDGVVVDFPVTIEVSGFTTLLVFSFIFAFTVGLLRGALVLKLASFITAIGLGYAWKIGQLVAVIAIAHDFGLNAFTFARYILAPSTDFVCIVSLWALGMSWLKKEETT